MSGVPVSEAPPKRADHGPVGLSLSDRGLVEPQDDNFLQRSLRLDLLHHLLNRSPGPFPVGAPGEFDGLVRHDLGQLIDEATQGLCDTRPPKIHKVQGFGPDIADLKSWKIQKNRDNAVGHPVSPQCSHLVMNKRKKITSPILFS